MVVGDFIAAAERAERGVKLFHAAQLRDLRTYVELGHVATRAELFAAGEGRYTVFDSDRFDQRLEIDQHVFGNLEDQGTASKNGRGIPNVYGPITLQFPPEAVRAGGFREVVLHRSGLWSGNARNREAITTIEALTEACDGAGAKPEVGLHGGILSLDQIQRVIVNPLECDGVRLINGVRALLEPLRRGDGSQIPVVERSMSDEGRRIYGALVAWIMTDVNPNRGELTDELRNWFDALTGESKHGNLSRFARYLRSGTLSAIQEVAVTDGLCDEDDWDSEQSAYEAEELQGYDPTEEEDEASYDDLMIEACGADEWYVDGLPVGEEDPVLAEEDFEYGQGAPRMHRIRMDDFHDRYAFLGE